MEFKHNPVLLDECIEGLNIKPDGIYVDGTLGGAGHSFEIIKKLSSDGLLIGIDRDLEALNSAKLKLSNYTNVEYIKDNHDNIKNILKSLNIEKANGILLDLGISSYQIDEPTRGFSYMKDNSLDMRMNKEQELTAKYIVNKYTEEELTNIFYKYGEEKFSKNIAKNIIAKRELSEINTTFDLVEIIENSIPNRFKNKFGHPAKRVFQALRIEVNGELVFLYNTIIDSIKLLESGGRICVITFHSLEDRIVKNAFKEAEGICTCPNDFPKCVCNYESLGKIITKKPLIATEDEQEENSRARSAKLRIFEKI